MQIVLKRRAIVFVILVFIFAIYLIFNYSVNKSNRIIVDTSNELSLIPNFRCWVDEKFVEAEKKRVGLGEHGVKVSLTDPNEIELNQKLYEETGFSVVVSSKISVNRSIPDFVHPECHKIKYFAQLPNVSVVIIYHNEVKSVLLRTVHSVVNRTPPELLHEVILVNDNSSNQELYEPLRDYVERNLPKKVKIRNLKRRSGLIVTRMEGARMATGEVLVFFDSHVEVQHNWLPPLLQPIVENRRIATLPIVDYFDPFTFEFYEGQESVQGKKRWQ